MTNPKHFSDEEREQLVAYLDGEVESDEVDALEAKVLNDSSNKRELDAYRRTWDLLELLPMPAAKQDFTHRTMELVTAHRRSPLEWFISHRFGQAALVLIAAAILLASFGTGLIITRDLWENPNREVLGDLPVLLELEGLKAVGDYPFLKELHESKVLDRLDTPLVTPHRPARPVGEIR
jgi:hypothetical protein